MSFITRAFYASFRESIFVSASTFNSNAFLDDFFVLMMDQDNDDSDSKSQDFKSCLKRNQEDLMPFGQRIPMQVDSVIEGILDPLLLLHQSLSTMTLVADKVRRDFEEEQQQADCLIANDTCIHKCISIVSGSCLSTPLLINGVWKRCFSSIKNVIESLESIERTLLHQLPLLLTTSFDFFKNSSGPSRNSVPSLLLSKVSQKLVALSFFYCLLSAFRQSFSFTESFLWKNFCRTRREKRLFL